MGTAPGLGQGVQPGLGLVDGTRDQHADTGETWPDHEGGHCSIDRSLHAEALRPRHEHPDPRPARDPAVRGKRGGDPDLRPRGDRPVQEGVLRARAQRPRGGAHAGRLPQGNGAACPKGPRCPTAGKLRVAAGQRSVPTTLRESQIADHLILGVALDVRESHPNDQTIFVTKDVNLRLRADALGLKAMDYEADRIDIDELYSGMTEVTVTGRRGRRLLRQRGAAAGQGRGAAQPVRAAADPDSPSHTALGRYDASSGKLVPLRKMRDGVWGIRPRNKEQHMRPGSAAGRRREAGHPGGQGGHRQDHAGDRRRAAEGGRGTDVLAAAGVAADLPAGPRRRLPARRSRAEAEPLDAADLRQRRVPDGPVQAGHQERPQLRAS